MTQMTIVFPKPGMHTGFVNKITEIAENTLEINLKLNSASNFSFISGQFINIKVSPTAFRSYSLSSDYKNHSEIEIIATIAHEGVGSNYLKHLRVGDKVTFIGPAGRFVLPETLAPEIVLIATGVGVAPFKSILYKLMDLNPNSAITLFYGIRNEKDQILKQFLNNSEAILKKFKYYVCVSQPDPRYTGLEGRVTDYYKINDHNNCQVFLCGNPNMVKEMHSKLLNNGVKDSQIYHEKFLVGSSGIEPETFRM